jgi:hypothetical protein
VTPAHGHGSRPISTLVRRLASTLGALVLLAVLALAPAAVPAGALVVKAEGAEVGLQPRSVSLTDGSFGYGPLEEPFTNRPAFKFANPKGEPVLPATRLYAIYWDPTDNYHGDWQQLIDGFFEHMGGASGSDAVFSVDTQYTDKENQRAAYDSTFMGAYTDTDRYPTTKNCTDPHPLGGKTSPGDQPAAITCLTNAQIQEELKLFIAGHSTLQKGMSSIYYLLTPPGVTVCLGAGGPAGHCSDYHTATYTLGETQVEKEVKEEEEKASYETSFCSYHSDISPTNPAGDANTVLYAVIPWIAGAYGDGHLPPEDQTTAFDCQDGGFNPASKPIIEEREKKQEKTKTQEEEEAKKEKTLKEKEAQEKQELLEGPHQEEPNQSTTNGPDGFPDTGLADLIISQIGSEQQNIVTDPLLKSWQGQEKVKLLNGEEVSYEDTDECRNFFYPSLGGSVGANELTGAGTLYNQEFEGGHYYVNDAFNLAGLELPYPAVPCLGGISLLPQFTSPNPVKAGETVGFDGMESDITLNWGTEYVNGVAKETYAVYKWNFGDGSAEVSGYAPGAPPGESPSTICEEPWLAPCAASAFHSYQYGGTYKVTLTVTDTGGNTASVTHTVTVVGPAPPSEVTPGGGNAGGGAGVTPQSTTSPGSSSLGSTSTTPGRSTPVPGPVATAAAVSASPKKVARSGLVIHYTVNEQVAGRFEVLLAAATAQKLGISGRVATGLPAGSPRALVIGQALLVTTKGGHSSVRIKFDKRTAKHLRRAHKVTLTLRMIVRNASKNPAFTTVTSTVVLHG